MINIKYLFIFFLLIIFIFVFYKIQKKEAETFVANIEKEINPDDIDDSDDSDSDDDDDNDNEFNLEFNQFPKVKSEEPTFEKYIRDCHSEPENKCKGEKLTDFNGIDCKLAKKKCDKDDKCKGIWSNNNGCFSIKCDSRFDSHGNCVEIKRNTKPYIEKKDNENGPLSYKLNILKKNEIIETFNNNESLNSNENKNNSLSSEIKCTAYESECEECNLPLMEGENPYLIGKKMLEDTEKKLGIWNPPLEEKNSEESEECCDCEEEYICPPTGCDCKPTKRGNLKRLIMKNCTIDGAINIIRNKANGQLNNQQQGGWKNQGSNRKRKKNMNRKLNKQRKNNYNRFIKNTKLMNNTFVSPNIPSGPVVNNW